MATKGLLERLEGGETVVLAEGYLFEFEEKGYLQAGAYVPEVVLQHPELLEQLHREFVHAGSDVVLAFTYYGHREKLRVIGQEDNLEKMNRQALKIARKVANETGTLMAGNISNTTIYKTDDAQVKAEIKEMFREQIIWAVEEGADFIIAETFSFAGEALLALEAIKEYGKGLPAVVCLAVPKDGLYDKVSVTDLARQLEQGGAAVVGLNCARGPNTMLPMLKELREVCKGPLAALPVAYRTHKEHPTFQGLYDLDNHEKTAFPIELDQWRCTRTHISSFTKECKELGIQVLGVCCGNRPYLTRAMAEALGRCPLASKYSANLKLHYSQLEGSKYDTTREEWRGIYVVAK